MSGVEDTPALREAADRWLQRERPVWLTRVEVLAECASTQDEARARCGASPGLLVIAARQTAGRGRLGRRWIDEQGKGFPATLVLDGLSLSNERASLVGGLASCLAVESLLQARAEVKIGLRWPNDVVVGAAPGEGVVQGPQRKIAGVLVERTDRLVVLGVGINVLQSPADWPEELRSTAVSASTLHPGITRAHAAIALLDAMQRVLQLSDRELAEMWSGREMLISRRAAFMINNERHDGIVRAIDPMNHIVLELAGGRTVRLPASLTSLVHGSVV